MKRKIMFSAICLVLAFIWIHSMIPGDYSAAESGWFTEHIVQPILSLFGIGQVSGLFVRKLAHVTEFFILSTLVTIFMDGRLPISFYACFTVAFLDESIQILSGRGAMIQDVWVDLIGVCIGLAVGRLVLFVCKPLKDGRKP